MIPSGRQITPSLSLAVSGLLCELNHIRSFSSTSIPLTGAAIGHLAALPELRVLELTSSDDPATQVDSIITTPHRFPVLREMTLWVDELRTAIQMIRSIQPAALEIMVFHVGETPNTQEIQEVFTAMELYFSMKALKRLYAFQDDFPGGDEDNVIDVLAFRPLLSFHQLEYVWMNGCMSFEMLDNTLISEMAGAWPHIRELDLGSTSCWGLPSKVTLEGLLALCAHCPELQSLGLTFDATADVPELGPQPPCNLEMEVLQVGHSRLDRHQVRDVAHFLRRIYPNLEECVFWDEGDGPGWQATRDAWSTVASLLERI